MSIESLKKELETTYDEIFSAKQNIQFKLEDLLHDLIDASKTYNKLFDNVLNTLIEATEKLHLPIGGVYSFGFMFSFGCYINYYDNGYKGIFENEVLWMITIEELENGHCKRRSFQKSDTGFYLDYLKEFSKLAKKAKYDEMEKMYVDLTVKNNLEEIRILTRKLESYYEPVLSSILEKANKLKEEVYK